MKSSIEQLFILQSNEYQQNRFVCQRALKTLLSELQKNSQLAIILYCCINASKATSYSPSPFVSNKELRLVSRCSKMPPNKVTASISSIFFSSIRQNTNTENFLSFDLTYCSSTLISDVSIEGRMPNCRQAKRKYPSQTTSKQRSSQDNLTLAGLSLSIQFSRVRRAFLRVLARWEERLLTRVRYSQLFSTS